MTEVGVLQGKKGEAKTESRDCSERVKLRLTHLRLLSFQTSAAIIISTDST